MQDFGNEFATSARDALSFLQTEHGFKEESLSLPDDSNSAYATYTITFFKPLVEPPPLRVRMVSTPARGELFLECNRGDFTESDRIADVRELVEITPGHCSIELNHAVSDAIGRCGIMQEHMTKLAKALRSCGQRFFDLDDSLWDDIRH